MALTGLVSDVQRFSVHDGPGLRTTVFLKGCPLRCAFCQNPESLSPQPEIAFYRDRCRDHGQCPASCPRGALVRGPERVRWERCDGCGLCLDGCPHGALALVGRRLTPDELCTEAARDQPFFETTGGGVTFSGGEPTSQLEFLASAATACRTRGLSVGLQTCGAFSWGSFEPHLTLFDFIHFDLKVMDPERHSALCGARNEAILENARRLARGAPVLFRMTVVPGRNDAEDDLAAVARFLHDIGKPRLHLLRYHAMGEAKLARLQPRLQPLSIDGADANAAWLRARDRLTALGIEVST